ncbi:hypothetical protein JMM81_01090 [Bacillus sp. V3B]|uniref:hypothetical protein n=1 Tax=Bacillus sp. V3B TaxID=2804915 RepID=UPI00210DD555|nr:hypothetical protein [Bacillus sp. V3B]MCQ6273569.1 hypothetical protein [Bacillus sp. V3B]
MIAFKGLYWKELKVSLYDFYIMTGLSMFMFIAGFGLTSYFQEPGIVAVISFIAFVMHVIYLPIFLLSSLGREGKTQLWLHNPNSGSKLLLAKLVAQLSYYFISLFIAFLVTYWTVNQAMRTGLFLEFQDQVLRGLIFVGVSITLMTIYFGIWVIFYWSFYHSMKGITYLKNIRWLMIFFVWMAISAIGNYIRFHPLFEKVTSIGVIQIHVLQGISFQVEQEGANLTPDIGIINFSIIGGLLYTILIIAVFFISVWLLERKVEV